MGMSDRFRDKAERLQREARERLGEARKKPEGHGGDTGKQVRGAPPHGGRATDRKSRGHRHRPDT